MSTCIEHNYKSVKRGGYGITSHRGKTCQAHRRAYVIANGLELADIEGLVIRHKCDNPRCINPDHLEPGTVKDNVRDMIERGRSRLEPQPGERNGRARLTLVQVEEIRRLLPTTTQTALARQYGVSVSTIHAIKTGRRW